VLSDSFQPSGTRKKAFFAATQLNISELHIWHWPSFIPGFHPSQACTRTIERSLICKNAFTLDDKVACTVNVRSRKCWQAESGNKSDLVDPFRVRRKHKILNVLKDANCARQAVYWLCLICGRCYSLGSTSQIMGKNSDFIRPGFD
jgi:ABC-type cobalamin transport system ATPase subunit